MNTTRFFTSVLALVFSCGFASTAWGQANVLDSDPLRARKLLVYSQLGAYAGITANTQGGVVTTDCNCQFTGGAATSFMAGVVYERLTRSQVIYGIAVGIENRSFESRFREQEGVMQRAPNSQVEYNVPVTFLNTANVDLMYLTANPFGKLTFFDALFVRGGPSASLVLSSRLKHTKELVDNEVVFPNGERATVTLQGTDETSVVLQDGELQTSRLQLGFTLATGLDFMVAKGVSLTPYLQYNMPFTNVSAQGSPFSSRALQILVECRMIF